MPLLIVQVLIIYYMCEIVNPLLYWVTLIYLWGLSQAIFKHFYLFITSHKSLHIVTQHTTKKSIIIYYKV